MKKAFFALPVAWLLSSMAHAEAADAADMLPLPAASEVQGVYYAKVPDIMLAVPVTPLDLYEKFYDQEYDSAALRGMFTEDSTAIANTLAHLGAMTVSQQNAQAPGEWNDALRRYCLFARGDDVLAVQQKDGAWLFITKSCLQSVAADASCGVGSGASPCGHGEGSRFIIYGSSRWDDTVQAVQQELRPRENDKK